MKSVRFGNLSVCAKSKTPTPGVAREKHSVDPPSATFDTMRALFLCTNCRCADVGKGYMKSNIAREFVSMSWLQALILKFLHASPLQVTSFDVKSRLVLRSDLFTFAILICSPSPVLPSGASTIFVAISSTIVNISFEVFINSPGVQGSQDKGFCPRRAHLHVQGSGLRKQNEQQSVCGPATGVLYSNNYRIHDSRPD